MGLAAVLVPAGPGITERDRVLDLLDALAAHEPALLEHCVVVDDDARPRSAFPVAVDVLPNPRRGRGIGSLGGTAAGTLAGLAHLRRRAPGAWVLRLDADALVVGPVVERVEAAWRPGDGILGSCSRTCNGERRDLGPVAAAVRAHERPVWAWRHPPRRPWWVRPADPVVRGVLREARAAGYVSGEHCIAAGCALSAPLVAALAARGWLDRPERWVGARLGDDMVLGAMARACGLALRDLHAVFGLQHVGLADTPERLLERGFGVVHSTKNDPRHPEAAVRAFFAGARGVSSALGVNAVDVPGGAEIALLRLWERLAARGWQTGLTTPTGDSPLALLPHEHARLDVGGLGAREGARAVASFPRALLLGSKWDVVYLNSTVCGRLLPALRGARTVLHVHDLVERVPRHWAHASLVLANSVAVAERLEGLEPHVVHAPIDLDPPHAPRPWPRGEGPVVGYVGRIEARKGVMDLIAAAPRIRERVPGARIVVVGGDPYESDPAYVEAVRASPDVEHHPWVENAPGLMRHLDVLVAPSHEEPFGMVLSEAMAVGTPVVATRVGGLEEVVEDGVTGALVAPGAPEELADGVARVLGARAAMGAAGVLAARRFDADAYADRVEALLRGLL